MHRMLAVLVIFLFFGISANAEFIDTAWVRSYNGPGNDLDDANGIEFDNFGNVYVIGASNFFFRNY